MLLGAERILLELVDDLIAKFGVKCLVVFPSEGPLVTEFERIGARCVVSFYGWWCDRRQPPIGVREYMWACIKSFERTATPAIREFDPDIIWTQTMVVPWGAMVAEQLQKPHVWYVTEYGEHDHGFDFFFAPRQTVTREILKSSDLVYVLSKSIGETLFPNAADRVRALYCHIPPPPEAATQGRTGFFTIPGAIKLGIFSQIVPSKGQQDIVEAVGHLSARGHNVELVIAGAGPAEFRERLDQIIRQHGIADRVKFIGFHKDVYPVLRELDIAVICSRMEAFGRVGVEAMLFSKPAVYPNTGGVIEYMVEGKTGYSYTPGDTLGLADRLERLMADPSRWPEMGSFARQRALQLFSSDAFGGEVYRNLQALRRQGRRAKEMPRSIEKLMTAPLHATAPAQSSNVGRNEPCPCGSGKKYKHCHGRAA